MGLYDRKNRLVTAFLALFTGFVGGHKFYLGETKSGILYLLGSPTLIPAILSAITAIRFSLMNERQFEEYMSDSAAASGGDEIVMRASGRNGQLILYENKIQISREGLVSTITNPFKGDKEILLDDIAGIQFRKPGLTTTGYIQIGQEGYKESDDGVFDATSDENSVLFTESNLEEFSEIKDEIDNRRTSDGSVSEFDSGMERLREKYAEGEITEEEYQNRKETLES